MYALDTLNDVYDRTLIRVVRLYPGATRSQKTVCSSDGYAETVCLGHMQAGPPACCGAIGLRRSDVVWRDYPAGWQYPSSVYAKLSMWGHQQRVFSRRIVVVFGDQRTKTVPSTQTNFSFVRDYARSVLRDGPTSDDDITIAFFLAPAKARKS